MAQQQITKRAPEYRIYQGGDADRLAELQREYEIAERVAAQKEAQAEQGSTAARFGDEVSSVADQISSVEQAREALESFIDEAAERAFVVRYQHIGSKRFRDLVAAHPPRQVPEKVDPPAEGETVVVPEMVDDPDDAAWGVNLETFPTALLTFRDEADDTIRTVVEPEWDEAELRRFVEVDLSEGDLQNLWTRVYLLNRGGSADPFEVRASSRGSRSTPATSSSGTASA